MDFKGKAAVITGGASGIGLATAEALAARGAIPVLLDIEAAALEKAAARFAGPVETHVCDVTSFERMNELAAEIGDRHGGVHVVFNNAGIATSGPVADTSHDDWRWTIDVDLWGPIHGVEAFLPQIRRSGGGGHLLFTASFAGLVPNVGLGPYCVAKYGVVALAEVLQKELRAEGIGVSVLCPMRVTTNIDASARNRQGAYGPGAAPPGEDTAGDDGLAGGVLEAADVADMVVRAIDENQLYVLPHAESRDFVRRRFERIERAFAHWHDRAREGPGAD